MGGNPLMRDVVSQVLYNLAFSPKIRSIDLHDSQCGSATVAEAIFKLIKISGAIENLNLENTGVRLHLTADFYKALGESKTLKYLNLSEQSQSHSQYNLLAMAIAMNAYKKGKLRVVSYRQGLTSGGS